MTGRVAVVTGGRGAIGRAIDDRLTLDGWRVVALDLPRTAPQDEASRARWVAMDATDGVAVAAAFAEVEARFGAVDLLVLAAGVTALGSFEETSDAAFRRCMEINFHGAIACLRAALPALRRGHGHVVVLSSVAGLAPVLGRPAYVASKHALTGAFAALRPELARDGIGVTLVHPTFVANELTDTNTGTAARSTTGSLVTPQDVADEIAAAVATGRRQVLPGRTAWLAYHVHRLAPRLYEWLMTRRLE